MTGRGTLSGPAGLAMGVGMLGASASAILLWPAIRAAATAGPDFDVDRLVLLFSTLPRLATCLLCGAALAAAGAILQQVLRNPLASPTTIGLTAGAKLALAISALWWPALLGLGRDLVALAGSTMAALVVFGLVRRQGFAPISLVLAGLVVSLYCGALSAMLVLLNDRYLVSLFIWGGGSLAQQGWSVATGLFLRLLVLAVAAAFIVRPLALLDLGDESAQALGLSVGRLRLAAVALAIALASVVTSAVGVIGFIGLISPTLVRLAGARRLRDRLVWSAVVGAALLLLTDAVVQMSAGLSGDLLPTGAVTALFGSPLILLLLPRLKSGLPSTAPIRAAAASVGTAPALAVLTLALLVGMVVSVSLGRGAGGEWLLASARDLAALAPWRVPRIAASLAAGAMLAVAGVIVQRLTGNEMASPEMLGISAGAALGVAVALFGLGATSPATELASASIGALAVLLAILALGRRSGFAPERMLLAGIALCALLDALVGALSASGDPRAFQLLAWMSGSTYGIDAARAATAVCLAFALSTIAFLLHRWLDLLPLGPVAASGLGLDLGRSRLGLMLIASLLTAAGTLIVGPLSFVGLMAPHLARGLGLRRPAMHLAGSALAGAGLMTGADWLGRIAAFPYQLPTGLVAALIGAPALLWLLHRKDLRA